MSLRENISNLSVIKPNQIGTGILIEYDAGFINPTDKRNEEFISEIKKSDSGKLILSEPYYVYAVLQKYNVLNRNGRIYPEHILRSQNKIYQELIRSRRALGEANHPENSIIDIDRVSHNIVETWWENQTLMGKLEILMSPGFIKYGVVSTKGDEVANLLRHRIQIGVSSRGAGTLKQLPNGYKMVDDDFEIICWDVVTGPSTPGAWIEDNPKGLQQYVESEIKKSTPLNESLDKFLLNK